jgi:hypothetical protein
MINKCPYCGKKQYTIDKTLTKLHPDSDFFHKECLKRMWKKVEYQKLKAQKYEV